MTKGPVPPCVFSSKQNPSILGMDSCHVPGQIRKSFTTIVALNCGVIIGRISSKNIKNILNVLKLPEMVLLISGCVKSILYILSISYQNLPVTSRRNRSSTGSPGRKFTPRDPLDSRTIRRKEFIQHGHDA